jgi:GxxExxY protein
MEKSKPEIAEGAENRLTERIIGAAIEVHRHLGPGLLESSYEACLCYELGQLGLHFQKQVHLPVAYKGIKLDCCYKMDLVVEDSIVVEIKAIDDLLPIHSAQLLTYLKSSGKPVGLLINFNVPILKKGLKRIVNHYAGPAIAAGDSAPSARHPGKNSNSEPSTESILPTLPPRNSPRLRVSAVSSPPAAPRKEPL